MIRKPWVHAGLWLVALALFLWALSRVQLADALRVVRHLDASAVSVLVALNLVALVVFGLRWWVILRGLGHPIGLGSASFYRLVAFGFSYFTPGPQVGGEPAQVLLAEKRHGIPRDVAIASVGLDRLYDGVVNLAFIVAATLIVVDGGAWVLAILLAIPLGYFLALARGWRPLTGIVPWDVVRSSEEHAGRFCRERPLHLALALAASFLSWVIMLAEYWLLMFFLGAAFTLSQMVLGLAAARVAYWLVFPAGLGVLEAGQIAAVRAMGFTGALGLSASLVIRFRDVVVATVGLWWGMRMLVRREPRAETR